MPTPIGNFQDMTYRAVQVLGQVAVVAAEDTRHARTLLQAFGITARLISYHDHNEEQRSDYLLTLLVGGDDVAVISDAGTPLINDPGHSLVRRALEAGVEIRSLPGASAVLTALVGSGLPTHHFAYGGFLPRRSGPRRTALESFAALPMTLVFFESPHRLADSLVDMAEVFGHDRPAALAGNLTKPHELYRRDTLRTLAECVGAMDVVRGQYTVVVGGAEPQDGDAATVEARRLIDVLFRHGADARLVRSVVRDLTDLGRNQIYDLVEDRSGPDPDESAEPPDESGDLPDEPGEPPVEAGEPPVEAGEPPVESGEPLDESGEPPDEPRG